MGNQTMQTLIIICWIVVALLCGVLLFLIRRLILVMKQNKNESVRFSRENKSKDSTNGATSSKNNSNSHGASVEVRTIPQPDPVRIPLKSVRSFNSNEYVDISELDMATIEGLNAIPDIDFQVGPPNSYGSLYTILYVLDRQVTAFKKSGDFEMELFCMKKCKKISESQGYGYGRLASELFRMRRFEEATIEREYSSRLSNEYLKNEANKKYSELPFGGRLFELRGNPICPQCYTLALKLYSFDLNTIKELNEPNIIYPPDNDMIKYLYCDLCGHVIATNTLVDTQGNLLELKQPQMYFEELETNGAHLLSTRRAHLEYNWMYEHIPESCPKSSAGYISMKKANSKNFLALKDKVALSGIELLPWMHRWEYEPIEKWTTLEKPSKGD